MFVVDQIVLYFESLLVVSWIWMSLMCERLGKNGCYLIKMNWKSPYGFDVEHFHRNLLSVYSETDGDERDQCPVWTFPTVRPSTLSKLQNGMPVQSSQKVSLHTSSIRTRIIAICGLVSHHNDTLRTCVVESHGCVFFQPCCCEDVCFFSPLSLGDAESG